MLVPKRVKHRREFRGKMRGAAKGGRNVDFGEYGLEALESHWITNRQIEAARVAMTRYMKRGGKVWIRIFPHKSYTSKGVGVRMGNGKGAPTGWVAVVKREKSVAFPKQSQRKLCVWHPTNSRSVPRSFHARK